MKILLASANAATFVERDARILRERHTITEYIIPHHLWPSAEAIRLARSHDLVVLWFATVRALPLVLALKASGKPLVTIIGGYEAVHLPEIRYGTARKPIDRQITMFLLRASRRIVSVSRSSQDSLLQHFPCDAAKLAIIAHGFEDLAAGRDLTKTREVLSVGNINRSLWLVKGQREFFGAAAAMPETPFVHVGRVDLALLAREFGKLPPNLTLMGRLPFERVLELYARAAVYVQISQHESFGCSTAEAMLFSCFPVVSNRFALPEVVGDCGAVVDNLEIPSVCAAISKALAAPPESRERARRRILDEFSYAKRRDALLGLVDQVAGEKAERSAE